MPLRSCRSTRPQLPGSPDQASLPPNPHLSFLPSADFFATVWVIELREEKGYLMSLPI